MHKGSQDLANRKGIIAFQAELRKELKDGDGHAFGQKASIYKQTIQDIDSTLKNDRKHMKETLGALTDMLKAANTYIEADKCFADHLENMGTNSLKTGSQHPTIGNALIKVSLLFKDVSSLMKIKIKSINESLIGPLKTFIELGAQKDLRESFEKTWKNYDAVMLKRSASSQWLKRSTSSQWNKKSKALLTTDAHIDGSDPFEDISESKRKAKHDVCDFMIKFNEISSKTGADFVTQLITLYDEEVSYFDKGKSCLNNLNSYMVNLRTELANLQANQEKDRVELQAIRDKLKPPKPETLSTAPDQRQKEEFSLTQAGDASFGINISGNLNKRTEGIHRWQKRFCKIENFHFTIAHNQTTPPTANLYLLTCQVKETPSSAVDGKKNCFHLISHDRTYHFEAPSETAMSKWTTVIRNNIDQSIKSEVGDLNAHASVDLNSDEHKLREFVKKIIHKIKTTTGNDRCVDCGKPDPTWFAVNLGVLVCIHCSGAHRKLGVHNSRIRSLDLDNPVTAELLLLYKVGNQMYNDVFKATSRPTDIVSHDSNLDERHAHIRLKHEDKTYIRRKCANPEEMGQVLHKCVESKDIRGLLQVFGEGVKLGSPIPNSLYEETALHIAVTKEDETSLHIVDFLAQNCQGDDIDKQDTDGKTALHFAVINNKPQSIKILLRGNANPRITDNAGDSPLDLVKEDQEECKQLLELAMNGKHLARCDVVNFNWEIEGQPDLTTLEVDYTDDELEDTTPEKAERHKSKRSTENRPRPKSHHVSRGTPGYNTVSGIGSLSHNSHNSHNLANQAAQIAANKKSFDPSAGGLVYNSSPRSSFSHQPSRSSSASTGNRPAVPLQQSPYRTSTNTGPGMNLPPNIPTNSPLSSRTGRKGSAGVNPGPPISRKSNKGYRTHGHESARARAGHSAVPGVVNRGAVSSSVTRNRSFTMDQGPGIIHTRHGSRQEHLEDRLMRSCSVSVTTPKMQRGDRDDARAMTVSAGVSGGAGPPSVPHRAPPALPPRTQRRRVEAMYDCEADDIDELSFKIGDIIVVVEEIDDSWWFGMIDGDDTRKGIFPKNFIRPYEGSR
ncbi:arf-GAP with SH3 domain, ANK repeat and PH domain-containing protein 1-like isoform X4 [Bolinopsis microptera]|uniref:arf-GAP with SH3 domain, ANK repeat and PH domain-containing protein 1-like isoform X4 n=1 Tax=Bolinopsis microptera TaxID=2820187 RepID=UPI00307A90CE